MTKLPRIVYLIVAIPLSSILVGIVMLIAATSSDVTSVKTVHQPLNKTSWQHTLPEHQQ